MKKSVRSIMSLGRGVFLAFGLVLCVAGFGAVAWKASASGGQSDDALPKGDASPKVVSKVTASAEDGIDAYDIRTDKSKSEDLLNFRQSAGKSASAIADVRDGFVTGEAALRERVPTLKVEYNDDIRIPEVIAPDLDRGNAFLTEASAAKHASILRGFVSENKELIGLENQQVGQLKVTADYTNPDGNLSYAHLEQTINGVPVFRGEIKAGFTRKGEMFRVINNLAPGLEYGSLSTDFRDPLDAVRAAAATIKYEFTESDLIRNASESTLSKNVFGVGNSATTAEKMYFPTEPGVARAAWRVLIWRPTDAFYVIVDAETGTMLWRKNISNDQTQSATYNVYTNPANMMNTANSPAPIVPALTTPNSGTQGTFIARNNVTLIGNEAPNTFNNLGWMTDGTNGVNGTTDGNNVEAGLDIDGTNGVDPAGKANGTNRVFNFSYVPGTDAPTLPAYRNGAVTQLFYTSNRYHDELYKLGFTEAARNFQTTNFTGMGVGGDRVSAEAQDSSGTNNANFDTAADGTRPRMQMYVFDGPNPDIDGDLDNDIVVHELTHGLSNRLVGNASGLNNNRGGSMGEGWSDFYGLALLSNPADPLAANYATAGYATYLIAGISTYTYNYYYGIRRFPYSIKSFTGGPNNLPHNPLTFADIDPAQINLSDGAFAANPVFASGSAYEVHNAGEVWCIALWEVRAQLITRLGAANGNLKSLQLVTDGLKLTPNSPNFIQARDAIIAAARATGAGDEVDVREGFRIRGMGFEAQDNGVSVVESFAIPNVELTDPFTVSDSSGDNDGFPEPGENVLLGVAITNQTGATVNDLAVNVNGGTSVVYGSIANAATVTIQIPYTVPAGAVCGSLQSVTINISSAAGTIAPQTRSFRLGFPVFGSATQNFDGVTAPTLPSGWTQTNSGANTGWVTTTVNAVSGPNSVFVPDPATTGEATLETEANITSASAQLSFSNRFDTERFYDGTVLEIRIGNGAYQDILAAGGSFASGGYTGRLAGNTPLSGRQAWEFNNGTGFTTLVNLPAAANGQTIGLRWRNVSNSNSGASGTWYDNMQLTGGNFVTGYLCILQLTTLVVTKTADTNDGVCNADCSLREALDVADGDGVNDVITFNIPADSANCVGANCTITVTSPLVPAAESGTLTTINGAAGANTITLRGGGQNRILTVGASVNLNLYNLNFTGGNGFNGAAIGITGGKLKLVNSALYGNSSNNEGGALRCETGCVTDLRNVTISGNSSATTGGGIYNTGTVTATNCTISGNSVFNGSGGITNNGTFNISNTIIAGNTTTLGSNADAAGTFTSLGYNLIGNASGANGFTATGDQTGVDARIAPLGNYGGKTLTHGLINSGTPSTAINTGTATGAPATDARGAVRIGAVDIGAFEVNNTANGGTFVAILPSGSQNIGYQTQIAANNGAFNYSVSGGALPNGVSLMPPFAPAAVVALQGTPTQTGTFNFAITATSGANSNTTNYRLIVLAPTAASVSVSGRVLVNDRGLRNAFVTLTDQNGNTRTVRSSSFGYYRFDEVEVGQTYIVSVQSKRFQFPTQVVSVSEELSELNFYSNGEGLQ